MAPESRTTGVRTIDHAITTNSISLNIRLQHPGRKKALLNLALNVLICLAAIGCVAPKRTASFEVPVRCMKVDSDSFTQPCRQRSDGKLLCDGVVVTATCVQFSQLQK
jgi:hypothetical protein